MACRQQEQRPPVVLLVGLQDQLPPLALQRSRPLLCPQPHAFAASLAVALEAQQASTQAFGRSSDCVVSIDAENEP